MLFEDIWSVLVAELPSFLFSNSGAKHLKYISSEKFKYVLMWTSAVRVAQKL